jgi:hypothetical protein
MAPREPHPDDDSEFGYRPKRTAPLISRAEPDYLSRTLLGAIVALLGFISLAAWNGNRELGEIRAEVSANTQATDRRISALEAATDRRLTALEQRVWKGE